MTRPARFFTGRYCGALAPRLACSDRRLARCSVAAVFGRAGRLTLGEACFTALSALTATGLSTIQPGIDLSSGGQLVLLVLMQLGSIGFTVLSVVVFMLIGRRITFAERVALRDTLGVFDMRRGRLVIRVMLGIAAIELAGALLLWITWSARFGAGRAAYLGLFHSVSAFSNASFDLFGGGGASTINRFPTDAATLLILAAIIASGSFGVPVIYDLLNWRVQPRVTLHTKITLGMWTTLTLLGTALIFTSESLQQSSFTGLPAPRRLLFALFHAIASRTSGLNVQPIENLAPASALVLTMLMFIGGAPALRPAAFIPRPSRYCCSRQAPMYAPRIRSPSASERSASRPCKKPWRS